MSVSLGELAVRFGCELRGDPDRRVEHVATLANADERALAFLANPRYRQQLLATRAGAGVLGGASAAECPTAMLLSENPYATYARIAAVLHPLPAVVPGVHPTALVSPGARVDPSAQLSAYCTIGERVVVGARSFVGPHSILAEGATLAADVRLTARVTLGPRVSVGARSVLQPGVVIGGDGFGFAPEQGAWLKVPQLGTVRIGDDVEVGANTTIDRGAIDDTVIEDGVKLDNQIQIGHNCRVGAHTAMAGCVAVAGSANIGRHCTIGAAAVILGHLSLADHVNVSAGTVISRSIHKQGTYTGMFPFDDNESWAKNTAIVRHLSDLADRVRALERKGKKNG